jgi:hypothetical protein
VLVAQTEVITKVNSRLDRLDSMGDRLERVENLLSKWDLTREIGDKIDAAVNTQETERKRTDASLEKAKVKASVDKFSSVAKVFEKIQEILDSTFVSTLAKISLLLLLALNALPRGCTIPYEVKPKTTPAATDAAKEPQDVPPPR